MTYSTNTDFPRDLLYKIRVLSTALAYQAFPLTAVHYSNIMINLVIVITLVVSEGTTDNTLYVHYACR